MLVVVEEEEHLLLPREEEEEPSQREEAVVEYPVHQQAHLAVVARILGHTYILLACHPNPMEPAVAVHSHTQLAAEASARRSRVEGPVSGPMQTSCEV